MDLSLGESGVCFHMPNLNNSCSNLKYKPCLGPVPNLYSTKAGDLQQS